MDQQDESRSAKTLDPVDEPGPGGLKKPLLDRRLERADDEEELEEVRESIQAPTRSMA